MMEYSTDQISMEKVKPTRDDWSHGTLLVIEELLRCSHLDGEVRPFIYIIKQANKKKQYQVY